MGQSKTVQQNRSNKTAATRAIQPSANRGDDSSRAKRSALAASRPRWRQWTLDVSSILQLAAKTFFRIDGPQWAEAFAFNAFFSLFPLTILLVTVLSLFVERQTAAHAIIGYVENYAQLDSSMQRYVFEALEGVVDSRNRASALALLLLVWTALQCFSTLVIVTNRAWAHPVHNWWRLPLRGLLLLGITAAAVMVGMLTPVLASIGKGWVFPRHTFGAAFYAVWGFVVPLSLLFTSLCLFYRFAPGRRTRFAEVWAGALCATLLLQATVSVFEIYLGSFATFNAVYGALGGIMALLLWIYLSGCMFIFGACVCAAQHEQAQDRLEK